MKGKVKMNAYYNENERRFEKRRGKSIIDHICSAIVLLTSETAIKIEKTVISAICFVAIFGVIGGIDRGSLNMFGGALTCIALVLVEYCVLRSIFVKKTVTDKEEIELDLDALDFD